MIDIVIGDPRVLGIGHCLVLVLRLGVERDDIPSVQKAGNVTKHAEEDVDYGVCGADARFYPNCTNTVRFRTRMAILFMLDICTKSSADQLMRATYQRWEGRRWRGLLERYHRGYTCCTKDIEDVDQDQGFVEALQAVAKGFLKAEGRDKVLKY